MEHRDKNNDTGGGDEPQRITALLRSWNGQDRAVWQEVLPQVIAELRLLAGQFLAREKRNHTLQPTALVNEVYLRLVGHKIGKLENRVQFFQFASRLMREILVDHARAKQTAKRGGDQIKIDFDLVSDLVGPVGCDVETVLAVDTVLRRLARVDPRQCQIVQLRFFTGLTLMEIADLLGVSLATVERGWRLARQWLARELDDSAPPAP